MRNNFGRAIVVGGMFLLTAVLTSCSGIEGELYRETQPEFSLEKYFDGDIKVWGIVQDRSGNIVNRFKADIAGSWQGNQGVLDETFYYDDKEEPEKRIWHITKTAENQYTGTAEDIVGTATGKVYGNALQWQYEMDLEVGGSTYRVHFDDWIWAMDDEVIINRSYIKKFGITMAEVTIFMQKK